jgi:methylated-DNA-[protein]-cysteine S-methyltransferase
MGPTMTMATEHTVLPSPLGSLKVVRDAEGLVGLYFPHHWYMPDPSTFGPRTDSGSGDVALELEESFRATGRSSNCWSRIPTASTA